MNRNRILSTVRILLTLGVMSVGLFIVLRAIDLDSLQDTLSTARWAFLIPSSLLNLITTGLIVYRWRYTLENRAGFVDCYAANQIGAYLNTFLPLRLGDFTRSYVLQRHVPELSKVAILASIAVELTLDMVILLLLLAVVLIILPLPTLLTSAGALLAFLTMVAVVSLFSLARNDWLVERLIRPLAGRWLPQGLADMGLSLIERAQDGIRSLRSNRKLATLLLLTVLNYAMQVISNWLLLKAFLPDASLETGLLALVGAGMGLALPLLPGAAGTYELAVGLALASLGIDAEVAAAFALVLHGQQIVITLITGGGMMLREGLSMQELRAAAEVQLESTQ